MNESKELNPNIIAYLNLLDKYKNRQDILVGNLPVTRPSDDVIEFTKKIINKFSIYNIFPVDMQDIITYQFEGMCIKFYAYGHFLIFNFYNHMGMEFILTNKNNMVIEKNLYNFWEEDLVISILTNAKKLIDKQTKKQYIRLT